MPTRPSGSQPRPPIGVLFVCTGNSARSPIAEALLRHHATARINVTSAGTRPKPRLHPNTVRVLRDQFGIDIADQHPRHVDSLTGRQFDYVITLCDKARENCSDFPHHPRRAHWSIPDPVTAGDGEQPSYAAFRHITGEIHTRVRYLLTALTHTTGGSAMTDEYVSVRYLVDDVQKAVDFYTTHLGFTLNTDAAPAFADVVRGPLRLLLSGPASSGARATPADAASAGRNRIHLIVDDLAAEIDRLRAVGVTFSSDLVTGPGGQQILLADPAGNLIELFQPADSPAMPTPLAP